VNDPVAVALAVVQVLDACGLRYLVGGSLASSHSGEPRSTLDVDIVVAMRTSDVDRVAKALGGEFEVDDSAVARAVRERSSVTIFHRASAVKVDLFVMGESPLDEEPMNRRQRVQVTAAPDRGRPARASGVRHRTARIAGLRAGSRNVSCTGSCAAPTAAACGGPSPGWASTGRAMH
jgi:hypothetical protein